MYEIKKETPPLALMAAYQSSFLAVRDDFWEGAFIRHCDHFSIYDQGACIAFFSLDKENNLTEFYALESVCDADKVFDFVMHEKNIRCAFVESANVLYYVLATTRAKDAVVEPWIVLYCDADRQTHEDIPLTCRLAHMHELDDVVGFQCANTKSDATFLRPFSAALIDNHSLYMYHDTTGALVATGELRIHKNTPRHAFLGVIVSEEHRGRGFGTHVFRTLKQHAATLGYTCACSALADNHASDRALRKAGFAPTHQVCRIVFAMDAP